MSYSKNLHHFHRQMMQIIEQDKHIHYFLFRYASLYPFISVFSMSEAR